MKVSFGALVISAGICGILSFAFLASSLGTDYWYIIETNPQNATDFEDLTSHSGLWRINEGKLQLLPRGLSTSYLVQEHSFFFQVDGRRPIQLTHSWPISPDYLRQRCACWVSLLHPNLQFGCNPNSTDAPQTVCSSCRYAQCHSGSASPQPGSVAVWRHLWIDQLLGPEPGPPHRHSLLLLYLQWVSVPAFNPLKVWISKVRVGCKNEDAVIIWGVFGHQWGQKRVTTESRMHQVLEKNTAITTWDG